MDAVELVSCFDDHGAVVLYHHLLSCGLRLAPRPLFPPRARTVGGGVERLVLHGPDGVLASGVGELEHEVTVDGGLWLAAAGYGDTDPHTVGAPVFAHTTPCTSSGGGRRASPRGASLSLRPGPPGQRERQLGDLLAVLDRARAFYRSVS